MANGRNQRNWLKAGEAADYLNVSYYTLRKYAQNGAIAHDSTPAGQMIFTKRQLDRFLATYSKKYTGDNATEDETPQAKAVAFYVRDSKGNQDRLNRQKERVNYVKHHSILRWLRSGLYRLRRLH